jgi:hypothetical protein
LARRKRKSRQSGRRPDTAAKFGRREAILVILLFIALGAWGVASLVARNSGQGDRGKLTQSGRSEASGVIPGERAPDLTIQTAEGGTFRLSGERGRVVVLDFLAPG